MSKKSQIQKGFTLIELLVSLSLFSVVCAGIVSFISDTLGRMSTETRASLVTQELKNALIILQSELRMSSSISPYNVGVNPLLVTCRGALEVTQNTVRFITTYDDPTYTNGLRSYYVGYEYDPQEQILYRGEVPTDLSYSCGLPSTDPLNPNIRQVIAYRAVNIDADNNGIFENIFNLNGNQLEVRIGIQVDGNRSLQVTHKIINNITVRVT